MLCFDIGANRGDFTAAALAKGYDVIALEPASIYSELVKNFIYDPRVTPLKLAVSDTDYEKVTFYEAEEDGLSTLNKDWLTNPDLPYGGKPYREITATTITLHTLVLNYGVPDLIKIDVEGAEWSVFNGLLAKMGTIAFEWTKETISEHQKQLTYLAKLEYKEVAPQFIEHHYDEPDEWFALEYFNLSKWVDDNSYWWENGGWANSGLRPTADVGMLWIR